MVRTSRLTVIMTISVYYRVLGCLAKSHFDAAQTLKRFCLVNAGLADLPLSTSLPDNWSKDNTQEAFEEFIISEMPGASQKVSHILSR